MAKGIETAAQRQQERQRRKEEKDAESPEASKLNSRDYTPVSSFLTARTVDPDGHPRRVGQSTPRSLAEIVGDENIFTFLHQYFVAILRCLGDQFGGLPLAEKPSVYQSVSEESPRFAKASVVRDRKHASTLDPSQLEKLRDNDATPKPQSFHISQSRTWPDQTAKEPDENSKGHDHDKEEIDVAKSRANKAFQSALKLGPQCAVPLTVNETAQRQVVV